MLKKFTFVVWLAGVLVIPFGVVTQSYGLLFGYGLTCFMLMIANSAFQNALGSLKGDVS